MIILNENDVAVLQVDRHLQPAEFDAIKKAWESATKTKAIILDNGVRLIAVANRREQDGSGI